MAGNNVLNHVFCNLLVLALTILLVIAEAEGKGQSSSSASSSGSSSSGSPSSSTPPSSGSKTSRSKARIAGYVVGGVVGVALLLVLCRKIRARVTGSRGDLEANNRDPEEDKDGWQRTLDHGMDRAGTNSDLCDVPPPQYTERATDEPERELVPPPARGHAVNSNPSGSTITPPMISIPFPEPSQYNRSLEPLMTINTAAEPSSMPPTISTRKNTLADKFKSAIRKAK